MSNEMGLENDTRIIKRNVAKGLLSRSSVNELLDKLPDMADQAEYLDPGRPEPTDEADE